MTANNVMKPKTLSAAILTVLLLAAIPALAVNQDSTATTDVTAQFASGGFHISGLRAVEIGGIVVLRGKTTEPAELERVSEYARTLGYDRVANVVALIDPPDDKSIERTAERALATNRSLDGCTFHIDSQDGVVQVTGKVQRELQKDVATSLLRNIDGVKEVRLDMQR